MSTTPGSARAARVDGGEPPVGQVVLAFATVYLIWGSTYLAIRFAIETMPPLGMAALRFVIAGGLLYGWARWRGSPPPTPGQWRSGARSGVLMLAGGNGAVVVAQQWVPSGLTALLVATVPLWLVLLDAAFGSRVRPTARTTAGLVVGFGGIAVLVGSPGVGAGGPLELVGGGIVLVGSLLWAWGSLLSRYTVDPPRPRMRVATQMLAGSVALTILSVATGELDGFAVTEVSARSWAAFAYLVVFGAIVGYGAYIWLLDTVEPARAGTYAYVNPVVALLLGWAFADEPLTFRSLLAAAIILGSVVMITTSVGVRRRFALPASPTRMP